MGIKHTFCLRHAVQALTFLEINGGNCCSPFSASDQLRFDISQYELNVMFIYRPRLVGGGDEIPMRLGMSVVNAGF